MKNIQKIMIMVFIIILTGALPGCAWLKGFDAAGYTQAVLDQMFRGDVDKAAEFMEDAAAEELTARYEENIEAFTAAYITNGMEMDEAKKADFLTLCRQIFKSQKYEVAEANKISRKEFDVTVKIRPTDVFVKFMESVSADSEELLEKAKNGEYQGTKEEINSQMQAEFVEHAYSQLGEAMKNASYGDSEKVVLKVKADENNRFSIEEAQITEVKEKILRLSEIQG